MSTAPLLTIRRYLRIASSGDPLPLDCGEVLAPVTLCYETFGRLNHAKDNVILICHALTGDSHAAGVYHPDDPRPGWWDQAIGPGKALDTDRYFVVCSNVLGGCQGSTGPSSRHPDSGKPYGLSFPTITPRDMVRAQARLLDRLGIERLHAVIGGSLGAMQALEWAVSFPDRMRGVVPIAGAGRFHPQGIAFSAVQRQAILADPHFSGGQYYDGPRPETGLAIARMLGMITYRSDESMWTQFGRRLRPGATDLQRLPESIYQVESYLHHHGDSLVRRFDANSYLYLSRAMDLQDLGRERPSYEAAHGSIQAHVLAIGIRSDLLFPIYLQQETVDLVRQADGVADLLEMDSPWGHDAFLVDFQLIAAPIAAFLQSLP